MFRNLRGIEYMEENRTNIRSENGSYTVEACISLFLFLMVIYVVFLQINTMIVENVLQKAVNSFAMDVSGYSYILDRAGLLYESKTTDNIDNASSKGAAVYNNTKGAYDKYVAGSEDMGSFVSKLYEDPEGAKSDLTSVGNSFKDFLGAIKSLKPDDFKTVGRQGAVELIKCGINSLISVYCEGKLKNGAYLPMQYDDFCRVYNIADGKIDISAQFMSGDKNNFTVLIWAECDINSPLHISLFDHRKIVKAAYSPLWVK